MALLWVLFASLCGLFSLCSCRPATDALPHSRDFYAGYIKALNDNFDALFKPERLPRSVHVAEIQAREEQPSGSTKILNEIIDDKNLQKPTDGGKKEIHKRDILGDDVNTRTVGKSELKTEVVPNNNNDLGVDRVLLTSNVTAVEDELKSDESSYGKSEISTLENNNASKNADIEAKFNLTESESSSGDGGESESTDADAISDDAESGSREDSSGDYESGNRETSTSDVGSGSMGTSDVASGSMSTSDVGSGSTGSNEKVPESVAPGNKKTGIPKMEMETVSKQIKGEVDFEDSIKESEAEKREFKSAPVILNTTLDDDASGEKKTITELGEEISNADANEKESETGGSGGEIATKRNNTVTEPNKQEEDSNYNMDEIEYEDTVTENDDKLLEENGNMSNKTTTEEDLGVALNEDSNNGVQKHTIPNKANDEGNFNVESSEDFDDDQDNNTENPVIGSVQDGGGDVDEPDADAGKPQDEQTVKKTITAEEDNTEKVANFKEDEDIEDHLPDTAAGSNQPDKDTMTEDKKDDIVTASRRTVVPKVNVQTRAHVQSHFTKKKQLKNASKKSLVGPDQLLDFPPESDLTASTLKKIEEPVGTPMVLPIHRDTQADEDNQLLNAPEPNYKKYIPGIESSTIEHSVDNLDEGVEQNKGFPMNQVGYLNPVTFFSQPSQDKRDEDDSLRRHYILDRSESQDMPYLSSPRSEGFPHVLRDQVLSPRRSSDIADNSMEPLSGSYLVTNRRNSGFNSYQPSPFYNHYEQQVVPAEDISYESRYAHGYTPQSVSIAPPSTRSDILSYTQRRRQSNSNLRNTLIRVPLSLIANFIQNAGGLYKSGNELARAGMYPHSLMNDRTGSVRSSVLSRRQYHQPVVLQPIFVLMPFTRAY